MARFTARVGLKLPFCGEKECDPREWRPFTFGGGAAGGVALFKNPVEIRRRSDMRKTKLARVSCRVSATGRKSGSSRGDRVADAAGEDDDDDDDEEFESDELSCFRGLVLDVSYRSGIFLFDLQGPPTDFLVMARRNRSVRQRFFHSLRNL